MTNLCNFFGRAIARPVLRSYFHFLSTPFAAVFLTCFVVAVPGGARADRGFFAEGGVAYWQSEASIMGARSRATAVGRAFRPTARRTAALGSAAPDEAGAETRQASPARRTSVRPAAGQRRAAAQRQAGGRPRLTPVATAKRAARTRVASLGAPAAFAPPAASATPSLSGGLVAWRASASCLAGNLRDVIERVASYGRVTVNSTCRSRTRNRRVGGASKSWHLTGNAVDLRISGNWRAAAALMRSSVGGFKHYGGGLFHIDNGPKRTF